MSGSMTIRVTGFNEWQKAVADRTREGELELPAGATVSEALDLLFLPADARDGLVFYLNGRPADIHAPLRDGDTLVFFSPMSGG